MPAPIRTPDTSTSVALPEHLLDTQLLVQHVPASAGTLRVGADLASRYDSDVARGRFITFEGVDGCGKSTQLQRFVAWLSDQGTEVVLVREPGGTELGEKIREILLDPATGDIAPAAEALLYAAARAELVAQVIAPAIERGAVVVADRFLESSLAYQGGGRELGIEQVRDLNGFAIGDTRPDAVVFLQIPNEVAQQRRDAVADRIELQGSAFFERVDAAYRQLAESGDASYLAIDGTGTPDEVAERVAAAVAARCPELVAVTTP